MENKNQYIPASITRSFTSSFASLNQQQHPNLLFTTSTASSPHALLNNARSLSPNGVEFNSRLQNLSLSNTSAETDSDQVVLTFFVLHLFNFNFYLFKEIDYDLWPMLGRRR